MQDMRFIIAQNIAKLRLSHGMTQAELAERLRYSDKAISKWERADSLPDIIVLKQLAELFSVRVDDLFREIFRCPIRRKSAFACAITRLLHSLRPHLCG